MTSNTPALTPLEALRELYLAIVRYQDHPEDQRMRDALNQATPVAQRTIDTYSWDAATIRQSRIVAGFSQVQLAKALGCNVQTIIAWERGHRLPSDDHRNKLTSLFTDQEGTDR